VIAYGSSGVNWSIRRYCILNWNACNFLAKMIITSTKKDMFLLSVCLCVSKITQKIMEGSFWNFQGMSGTAKATSDSILGMIRKKSWITLTFSLTLLSMGHKGNRCQTEYGAATWRTTWRWRRSVVSDSFLVIWKFRAPHATRRSAHVYRHCSDGNVHGYYSSTHGHIAVMLHYS